MTDEQLTVSREINAPATDLFEVITLPRRHREFDASGMVVSDDRTDRIQAVGDTFRMNMHHPDMGDYVMENHVIAYADGRVVGWAPAEPGEEPLGWTWVYTLAPQGPESTLVSLTYDWSGVKDMKGMPKFPAIPAATLEESLAQLASLVA